MNNRSIKRSIPLALAVLIITSTIIIITIDNQYLHESKKKEGEITEDPLYLDVIKYGANLKFKKIPAPLLKMNSTHPRLYLTKEKITKLRKLIKGLYWELWIREKTWVDKWLNKSPQDVYYHDPEEMLWQRAIGNMIPHFAFCYLMTQNEIYLKKAKEWIFYAINLPKWGPYPDLAKAHLLYGISLAYDWLYHDLTLKEKAMIRTRLAHEARLMFLASIKTKKYKTMWWHDAYLQNHLWVDMCSLATAGFALYGEIPDAEIWINQAHSKFLKILDSLGTDGASHEGVSYWSYGMEYLLKYLDLARELLECDLFNNTWLKKTAYYRLYMSLPRSMWKNSMTIVNIADCPMRDWYGPDYILRKLAAEYRNSYAQWLAYELSRTGMVNPVSGWLNLIWYDPSVPATPPYNLSTMKHFDDLDIVVIRDSWKEENILFVFKCGPFIGHNALKKFNYDPGGGHVHPDVNHFILIAYGKWLIVDDGYLSKKTSQHNTIVFEINGKEIGQLGEGSMWFKGNEVIKDKRISAIIRAESNPIFDYIIGDAYNIYPDTIGLKKFLRHIIYLKPDTFIIIDEIQTTKPLTPKWLLHYKGTLQKTEQNTLTLTNNDVSLRIYIIQPHEFEYRIYEQTGKREGGRTKKLNVLEITPTQKTDKIIFIIVLHPAKIKEKHPTITEIHENGKPGLIIQYKNRTKKLLFNLTRKRKNDRIFKLIGIKEPINTYNFTRELPSLEPSKN